jgi:hypothetical protein
MNTRSDTKYDAERMNSLIGVSFYTSGPCPSCKKAEAEVLKMYETVYDLVIDMPRKPIINVGPTLGPAYLTYKIAEILGYTHILEKFTIGGWTDLREKDAIWKAVCRHMDWVYIHGNREMTPMCF